MLPSISPTAVIYAVGANISSRIYTKASAAGLRLRARLDPSTDKVRLSLVRRLWHGSPEGCSELVSEPRFRALLIDGAREVHFERVTVSYNARKLVGRRAA